MGLFLGRDCLSLLGTFTSESRPGPLVDDQSASRATSPAAPMPSCAPSCKLSALIRNSAQSCSLKRTLTANGEGTPAATHPTLGTLHSASAPGACTFSPHVFMTSILPPFPQSPSRPPHGISIPQTRRSVLSPWKQETPAAFRQRGECPRAHQACAGVVTETQRFECVCVFLVSTLSRVT